MKDVQHVSKGKKGKRAKSCVSNGMEKVLFQVSSDRGEISFFEKLKKTKKNNPKSFEILFSGLNIMIVFMK